MNEQKPLGYMGHGAANRLSNAGEVEYVHAARHDAGDRAVFLHPDPSADKLRARVRVLEAEAKSMKTALHTALDSSTDDLCDMIGIAADYRQRAHVAEDQLAAESRKVGEQATEIDRLRDHLSGVTNFLVGSGRSMPPIGAAAWLDANTNGWTQEENDAPPRQPRWVTSGTTATMGAQRFGHTPAEAREALARALGWPGAGKGPARPASEATVAGHPGTASATAPQNRSSSVRRAFVNLGGEQSPKPDRCPLPAVGEWVWSRSTANGIVPRSWLACNDETENSEWSLTVSEPLGSIAYYDFEVGVGDIEKVATGIRRTRTGAKRAAERAARHAWKIRNGAAK